MASPAEHDLALSEADHSKEKAQVFGILRLQEEKSGVGDKANSSSTMRSGGGGGGGDGRWQAPIFALARKASETISGSIHVLPKVSEHRTSLPGDWTVQGGVLSHMMCSGTIIQSAVHWSTVNSLIWCVSACISSLSNMTSPPSVCGPLIFHRCTMLSCFNGTPSPLYVTVLLLHITTLLNLAWSVTCCTVSNGGKMLYVFPLGVVTVFILCCLSAASITLQSQ